MSTEENKTLTRRIAEEIINKGNYDVANEVFAEDYIGHGSPEDIKGPEAMKQYFSQMRSAFPDIKSTTQDQIAEGDKVVDYQVVTGTHKGEFQGIASTGKQIKVTATIINRIAGGKIVESWSNLDMLSLMVQLGVVPPPK